jgi:hypothetical protein
MLVKDRHALIRSEEFQKAAEYGKITESPQMLLLSTCLCFFCLRVLQEALVNPVLSRLQAATNG